jgi:polyribonucleotide nucleotidyltransferase
MQSKKFIRILGGKEVEVTFSDLAGQANGSVMIRTGDTLVLVTATMGSKDRTDLDYFPLSVEFEERYYAAGQRTHGRLLHKRIP